MRRVQLRALLAACPPSIVFDARPREVSPGAAALEPFFEHTLLKNVILIKTAGKAADDNATAPTQTRIYFPFDPKNPGNGGMSMRCDGDVSHELLEKFAGVNIDRARIATDLRKLAVLTKLPSFSPFLLRDAFERAGLTVDARHFRVSDADAEAMRGALKAKLKPLAAMALALPANSVGDARLDVLAHKLWDLDDEGFLIPFGSALKIPEGQTIEVLYAWIGVSYFQREFSKRQTKLRELAEWLAAKPGENSRDQLDMDRGQVRDALRWAWTQSGGIFARYSACYDALINDSDAKPFVAYLSTVRGDFAALGARMALIEQAACIFDVLSKQDRGSQLSVDLLQDLASSLRDGGDNRDLAAA